VTTLHDCNDHGFPICTVYINLLKKKLWPH